MEKKEPRSVQCLAGGLASITTEFLYYPLDTLKTRLQASQKNNNYIKTSSKVSLFSGFSTSIVSIPHGMVFFLLYEESKQTLLSYSVHGSSQHVIAASVAEIGVNLIRNPFEVVKQQMQIGLDNKISQVISNVYRINGAQGFYAGYLPLLMREIPFSAIQFGIYEWMRSKTLRKKKELTTLDTSINAAFAALIAAALTNPIDVVKTKMMVQRKTLYLSTLDCIQQIHTQDGIQGFLRGITIRIPMITATGVIFFSAYEQAKRCLSSFIH